RLCGRFGGFRHKWGLLFTPRAAFSQHPQLRSSGRVPAGIVVGGEGSFGPPPSTESACEGSSPTAATSDDDPCGERGVRPRTASTRRAHPSADRPAASGIGGDRGVV